MLTKDCALYGYVHVHLTHCGDSQIQREAQHCDGAVFRKLTKHLDEMFARDFPFYLIVAFRVHRCVF